MKGESSNWESITTVLVKQWWMTRYIESPVIFMLKSAFLFSAFTKAIPNFLSRTVYNILKLKRKRNSGQRVSQTLKYLPVKYLQKGRKLGLTSRWQHNKWVLGPVMARVGTEPLWRWIGIQHVHPKETWKINPLFINLKAEACLQGDRHPRQCSVRRGALRGPTERKTENLSRNRS